MIVDYYPILCIFIAVRINGQIGLAHHLVAQKMKAKIATVESRLGVFAKENESEVGGKEGRRAGRSVMHTYVLFR
jgi:hypothetical protein